MERFRRRGKHGEITGSQIKRKKDTKDRESSIRERVLWKNGSHKAEFCLNRWNSVIVKGNLKLGQSY